MLLTLRAKEEVDEVLGTKREILYDDLGKLTYLSQVSHQNIERISVFWLQILSGVRDYSVLICYTPISHSNCIGTLCRSIATDYSLSV